MMIEEGLRLTAYFGERDRAAGGLLADALIDVFARHRVRTSVLLRGIEGFGIGHRLATERLLTLSEDVPLLALAVDEPARIEAVLEDVRALSRRGAITLERARMSSAGADGRELSPGSDATKLTVYVGRQERVAGRLAYLEVVDCLRRCGVAGASVLLGLDGTVRGERRRGRLLARNAQVPLMIQSVGEGASVGHAMREIAGMLSEPAMTVERVRVCKRDGVLLDEPLRPPAVDAAGLGYWQKLVVYTSERTLHGHEPVHGALVRRLRREGAAGATALRGQWGYHGEHAPHGEAFWSIRRHVPVLTLIIDTPEKALRWFATAGEMTREGGLVTSEIIPALRAVAPGIEHGGLELADRHGRSPG